jgi:hypothetical protein
LLVTAVLTRATRRNIPEDTILHSHRRENLKSYINLKVFTHFTFLYITPIFCSILLQMAQQYGRAPKHWGIARQRVVFH